MCLPHASDSLGHKGIREPDIVNMSQNRPGNGGHQSTSGNNSDSWPDLHIDVP